MPSSPPSPPPPPVRSTGPATPPVAPASKDGAGASTAVAGSILSLGGGEVAARVVAFVGTAYLARVLTPDGFGVIGFALAIAGYLSLAIRAGVDAVGAREVARAPAQAARLAASVSAARLLFALVAFAVIAAVALVLPKPPVVRLVLVLTGLSFFTTALDTAWVHKGLERNRRVGLSLVVNEGISVGLILLVIAGPADLVWVPVLVFAGQLAAAAYLAWPLFRAGLPRPELRLGLRLFRLSGFLIVTKVLRTLLFTFDVVLMGFWLGEREVGLYTAPYRVCNMLAALSASMLFAYLPEFARASARLDDLGDAASRSVELAWALAAPVAVGGILVAQPLLVLLFGGDYVEGALAFQWLLVATALILVRGAFHNVFLVRDQMRTEMLIMAAAVALNVVLNVVLIPRHGLVGAAVATAAAEALVVVLCVWAIARIGVPARYRSLARPLLAAAVMGAVLWAVGDAAPVLARVGLGASVYAAALWAVGGVPRDLAPHLPAVLRRSPRDA